jgi:hypothetical protein
MGHVDRCSRCGSFHTDRVGYVCDFCGANLGDPREPVKVSYLPFDVVVRHPDVPDWVRHANSVELCADCRALLESSVEGTIKALTLEGRVTRDKERKIKP